MENFDNRVDAYIARSADFAKPVLIYLREIAHEAAPMKPKQLNGASHFLIIRGRYAKWRLLNNTWRSDFGRLRY
jgi:hypothetical protein